MQVPMFRTALVLGLLSAVGPFAIDMYLPALPSLGADLGASVAEVQATLTAYFIGFGVAQLVYGPLSDQMGRRRVLLIGLAVFLAATMAGALAPGIASLLVFRFLQGLGGAVVMVVPRAIIRDVARGTEATRLMAMIMLVISVSPMLAPLAGSGLLAFGGWRLIFWALAAATILSVVLILLAQPETLAPENRVPVRPGRLLADAGRLLRDPVFMSLTFVGGFGIASFFVFIASASFVYTQEFGLSPTGFSLAFAVNALGFFGASQMAAPLGERFGMGAVVRWATMGFAGFALLLLSLAIADQAGLLTIVSLLFCGNACLGLVIPSTMVMALDDHGEIAGLASSLGGTLQMLAGGLMILATGPFFDGTALPMIGAIAACAVLAFALASIPLGARRSGGV